MDARITQILVELKTELRALYGDRFRGLYLYGSYARGTQRLSSDLDVLFLLDDLIEAWPEIQKTSKLVSDLSLEYDLTVSLIPMKQSEFELGKNLLAISVTGEGIAV